MYNYNDLVDKTVLVTGASGDIGHAICGKFLEQGCVVYALYCTNKAQLKELQSHHPAGKKLHLLQGIYRVRKMLRPYVHNYPVIKENWMF